MNKSRALTRLQGLNNHFTSKKAQASSQPVPEVTMIGDDKCKYPDLIDHKP